MFVITSFSSSLLEYVRFTSKTEYIKHLRVRRTHFPYSQSLKLSWTLSLTSIRQFNMSSLNWLRTLEQINFRNDSIGCTTVDYYFRVTRLFWLANHIQDTNLSSSSFLLCHKCRSGPTYIFRRLMPCFVMLFCSYFFTTYPHQMAHLAT